MDRMVIFASLFFTALGLLALLYCLDLENFFKHAAPITFKLFLFGVPAVALYIFTLNDKKGGGNS